MRSQEIDKRTPRRFLSLQRLTFTSSSPCARVIPVPILSDNYAYLLVDDKTKKTACIDPAEPSKLLEAAKKEGLKISTVSQPSR